MTQWYDKHLTKYTGKVATTSENRTVNIASLLGNYNYGEYCIEVESNAAATINVNKEFGYKAMFVLLNTDKTNSVNFTLNTSGLLYDNLVCSSTYATSFSTIVVPVAANGGVTVEMFLTGDELNVDVSTAFRNIIRGDFRTLSNIVTDYDGNSYDGVLINGKIWMASNLRTTHYSDGTSLVNYNSCDEYCTYLSNDSTDPDYKTGLLYKETGASSADFIKYGLLYNLEATMRKSYLVDSEEGLSVESNLNPSGVQGIAPNGWHIPSYNEWIEMLNYVAGTEHNLGWYDINNNAALRNAKITKSLCSTEGWLTSNAADAVGNNQSSNNGTNFNIYPAGVFLQNVGNSDDGPNYTIGQGTRFWTTKRDIYHDYSYLLFMGISFSYNYYYFNDDCAFPFNFLSVRCVKD